MAARIIPTAPERDDGTNRPTGTGLRRGRWATAARARSCGRVFRLTPTSSPRRRALLRGRRQLGHAEEFDLVLQDDAVLLERPPAGLDHERDGVLGPGPVRVFDEVRVQRRDLRPADAVTLEAAGLEHPARRQLVLGILED